MRKQRSLRKGHTKTKCPLQMRTCSETFPTSATILVTF